MAPLPGRLPPARASGNQGTAVEPCILGSPADVVLDIVPSPVPPVTVRVLATRSCSPLGVELGSRDQLRLALKPI
jgi:hypothetical protein